MDRFIAEWKEEIIKNECSPKKIEAIESMIKKTEDIKDALIIKGAISLYFIPYVDRYNAHEIIIGMEDHAQSVFIIDERELGYFSLCDYLSGHGRICAKSWETMRDYINNLKEFKAPEIEDDMIWLD